MASRVPEQFPEEIQKVVGDSRNLARDKTTLSSMQFRYPFRRYQTMILEHIVPNDDDEKYHLVAPPGSGKTIVGLELIRRFGQPAVVFAPTSTIQLQWAEQVAMFTKDQATADELTALDPNNLSHINTFTYQLISVPSKSRERVQAMALLKWREDLLESGKSDGEQDADARINLIKQNNPAAYRREMSRRYLRIKRQLLRDDSIDIGEFLHPNALELIDSLVEHGVQTVVLDECHHLLDYWAIVLRHLIKQIDSPKVIGLTATLPSPDGDDEFENYDSLLGSVDFEVPTPAVVKEGNLAPYRDLVFFVKPSKREIDYLENIKREFEAAIAELVSDRRFVDWLQEKMLSPADKDGNPLAWGNFWKQYPLFSVAGYRFLHHIRHPIEAAIPVPFEAQEQITLDDWIVLLENYALRKLVLSSNEEDHHTFRRLRNILLPFGMTLTERGMHQTRSAGDLVLTFSESKDHATAHILKQEYNYLGDRLRAVVVTDFERKNSGVKKLTGVLDEDAGSAQRLFRNLSRHAAVGKFLNPMLVTGRTVMVSSQTGERMVGLFNQYLGDKGINAICKLRPAFGGEAFKVVGEGSGWKSSLYVRMITEFFETGETKCLVGTRGIFGEGWDSLSLNTLVDLTSVTTSTSVQQLRGRSIRKDPNWPNKVAHNWDVVTIAPKFDKGHFDLNRFIRRHNQYWGIVIYPRQGDESTFATPRMHGKVVKGLLHVSPLLNLPLIAGKGVQAKIALNIHNARMIREARDREKTYALWNIGENYHNFSFNTTQLHTNELKIHTVFTVQNTLKAMFRAFRATFIETGLLVAYFMLRFVDFESPPCLLAGLVVILMITFIYNARNAYQLGRKFLVEQPPDAILKDVAIALLSALRDEGLVSRHLPNEYIRVVETENETYQVFIDYASPEDASTFVSAYRDIFAPLRDQRYIILRTDNRLPSIGLRAFWLVLRAWIRDTADYPPAYYPVPKILASRKARAMKFAHYWERFVGGGKLVFTRAEEGRYALLNARVKRRPEVYNLAFEMWR